MSGSTRRLEHRDAKLRKYIDEGKAFSPQEREIAALALQHVEESEQEEIDAAWDEEIAKRLDDIVSGRVELVCGRETMEIARSRGAEHYEARLE